MRIEIREKNAFVEAHALRTCIFECRSGSQYGFNTITDQKRERPAVRADPTPQSGHLFLFLPNVGNANGPARAYCTYFGRAGPEPSKHLYNLRIPATPAATPACRSVETRTAAGGAAVGAETAGAGDTRAARSAECRITRVSRRDEHRISRATWPVRTPPP